MMPSSGLGKGVLAMASGSALGQIASVLAIPILTRLFTRAETGLLNSYTAIISLLSIVSGGRYEQAVPIAESDDEAAGALGAAVVITLGLTLVSGITLALWGLPLLKQINAEAIYPFCWVIPVGLLAQGLNLNLSYWATRRKAFGSLGKRRASIGITTVLLQIAAGVIKMGPAGLLLGYGLGQGAGMGVLLRNALAEDRDVFRRITFASILSAMKRYSKFPLLSVPAAFTNSLALTLPAILMARLYGQENNGDLGLAMRIMAFPISLIGAAVGQAFLGSAPDLLRDTPKEAEALFNRLTRKLAKMSIGIVVMGIAGIWCAPFIFGEKWIEAGHYMALLGLAAACQFITSPISQITTILERQDLQLAGDVARSILITLAFWGTRWLGGTPLQAVGAYSLTMVFTYGGFFAMYRWLLKDAVKRRLSAS